MHSALLDYLSTYPREMNTNNNSQSLHSIFFLVFLIALIDAISLSIFSDFWSHPTSFETKFGVFSGEIINAIIFTAVLLVPVYFVSRYLKGVIQYIIVFCYLSFLFMFVVSSWIFYSLFERFLGKFAFQMLMSDGRQILDFTRIMPSSGVGTGLIAVILLSVFSTTIFLGNSYVLTNTKRIIAATLLLLLTVTVPVSLIYNKPHIVEDYQSDILNKQISRTQSIEFELLQRKSGPFNAISMDVTSLMASSSIVSGSSLAHLALTERLNKERSEASDKNNESQFGTRLNLVFIMVESLRKDRLSAYGGDPSIMPTVNSLSNTGFIFENLWAQSSHSNYADIAAISGQYPLRSDNIHFYPKNPDYPRALPYDILGPQGYMSGIFSSQNEYWGQMNYYLESPNLNIFKHVGNVDQTIGKNLTQENSGVIAKEESVESLAVNFAGFMYRSTGQNIQRLDEDTIKDATLWLDSIDEDQPFSMILNLQASHAPYNALPENFERVFLTEESENADHVRNGKTSGRPVKLINDAYNDALRYVDNNIGDLVSKIESRSPNNTVYVITADTSMKFSANLIGNGGKLYSDVLSIPAIVHTPSIEKQVRIQTIGGQIDLMPTALSLIGFEPHPASQGLDIIGDKERAEQRIIFSVAQTPVAHQYSAILEEWQLIYDNDSRIYELYYIGIKPEPERKPLSESETQFLVQALNTWIGAQVEYHSNSEIQHTYYAPKYFELSRSNIDKANLAAAKSGLSH